jgi:DNA polymerase beta
MNEKLISEFNRLINYHKATGGNSFKIRSFQKGLRLIKEYPNEITSGDDLAEIKGIGKGTISRIDEILEKGHLSEIKDDSNELKELSRLFGVGPKVAAKLLVEGVTLQKLIDSPELQDKWLNHHQKIGLKYLDAIEQRIPRAEIDKINSKLEKLLYDFNKNISFMICGSYRRGHSDSGDIDVLVYYKRANKTHSFLVELVGYLQQAGFLVDNLTELGETKYMGMCKIADVPRRIDIRFLPRKNLPFAILYFTGSGEFNKRMRKIAIDKGLKLNEYSLTDTATGKELAAKNEKDIFALLDMEYVHPEMRKA